MNATMKQVTEIEVGGFTLELDEKKMGMLVDICSNAAETVLLLSEQMDALIRVTDHYFDSEQEAFPLLRTLVDVKSDLHALSTLVVRRKEANHG